MTEISVIIPVYRTELYLERCIDSVLRQTFRNFELILVDDGSPDKCGEICDRYAKIDDRIKVIHQTNAGVSAARNHGLELATGAYTVFIDSDDWVDEHYLMAISRSDADFVAHAFSTYSEDGRLIKTQSNENSRVTVEKENVLALLNQGVLGYAVCKRFSMDIIRKYHIQFNKDINHTEDTLFVLDYLEHAETAEIEDENHYAYVRYETRRTLSNVATLDRLAMICTANVMICSRFFAKDSEQYRQLFFSRVGYGYMSYLNSVWLKNMENPFSIYRFLCSLWKNDDISWIFQYAPDAVWKLSLHTRVICAFQERNAIKLFFSCLYASLVKGKKPT